MLSASSNLSEQGIVYPPLADIQLRRKPSHAQRGISSQTLGSTAHDWVRLARVQVAKQKTLDPREPRGAVRSFH
jgi:hypothetical protein